MRVKVFQNVKKPSVNAKALNLRKLLLLLMPCKFISPNGSNNSMRKKNAFISVLFFALANISCIGRISTFLHPGCLKAHIEISEERHI